MNNFKAFFAATLVLGLFAFAQPLQAQCNHGSGSSSNRSTGKASWTATGSDIVDLAIDTEALSTLVAAVKAGGLVETLKSDGPFTVFAPSNEAFAALPEGTLASLLKPENKATLVKILTYHVVPGKVYSHDLRNGQMAKTVQGEKVSVKVNDYGVRINNSKVIQADVKAANGVVHVIDEVLLPPTK